MREDASVDRRTVLRSVGTIAAAGVFAGCGGSGGGGSDGGGSGGGGGGSGYNGDGSGESTPTPTPSPGGDGGTPEFGGYLDDVGNYEGSVADRRGESEVTVEVGAQGNNGAFAFSPPAVRVDAGTTVVWEWTGEGGQHNVVSEDGTFESALAGEAGHTYEYTFEEGGVFTYFCQPHKGLGMKGAVVVE